MKGRQMRQRAQIAYMLVASLGLFVAGCGENDKARPSSGEYAQPTTLGPESSPPTTAEPQSSPPASPTGGSVEVKAKETSIGKILVDGTGRTLYIFEKDNSNSASTCTDVCAKEWPPLLSNGAVTGGPGTNANLVTTFDRPDGTKQVAYYGWPLYYYTKDANPGDMNGQGVISNGAPWYVIGADNGEKIEKK
jgi:predicted lipoprotein with Yx(FWY)xxD motif